MIAKLAKYGVLVCALSFVACGGSGSSTPKCGDKDVQEEMKKELLKTMEKEFEKDRKRSEFANEAIDILIKSFQFKFDKFITEKTDETKKRVVCKATAEISMNASKESVEKMFILEKKHHFLIDLDPGEKMTDKKFEELVKKEYGSMSKFERAMEKEIEESKDHMKETKELEYTAQRTDDGKLIVEIESKI